MPEKRLALVPNGDGGADPEKVLVNWMAWELCYHHGLPRSVHYN